MPQGTLIERIRAGGFGLGGILTPTGVGTRGRGGQAQDRRRRRRLSAGDAAARRLRAGAGVLSDYLGNLVYALTARNFNPVIAMAATTVIVDAEHIVPVGVISPDHVVTPAPLVDYVIAHE